MFEVKLKAVKKVENLILKRSVKGQLNDLLAEEKMRGAGFLIRNDIDQIRIRIWIQPLRTIRIHEFFLDRIRKCIQPLRTIRIRIHEIFSLPDP